jgi:SAM-dependent methyltransferase
MPENRFHTILGELVEAASRDDSLAQFRTTISAHQYLRLYECVARHVKPGGHVLDWGAGNGHFSYFLLRAGYKASGFDCGPPPAICNAFGPDAFAYTSDGLGDPSRLPYESASFDAVASVGVLEHVRETGGNELASLNEICRVLRPGGVFLCFHLPNQHSWIEAVLRLVGRWSHRYRYTASSIQSLATKAGLELVAMQRYAILPRNIWWWGLPRGIGASPGMARAYDRMDGVLSRVLSPVCQNYLFVARKRA